MAGKSNTSATFFAQKKLLGKAHTSNLKVDGEEVIGSNIQTSANLIFGQGIPTSPTTNLYDISGTDNTVEYIPFVLEVLTGSTYDANTTGGGSGTDSGESSQVSGPHAYKFKFPSDYQSNSSNSKIGNGSFNNNKLVHETLGSVQLIPPFYSQDAPNPYTIKIFKDNGSGGIGDEIPLLDNIDWNVDYYNGILFLQDYRSDKIPAHAKAFAYIGKMLDEVVSDAAASGGSGGGGGSREKRDYEISSTIISGSAFTATDSSFTDSGDDITLIDVFYNGQLMLSGTNSEVGTLDADYFTLSTNQIKFGFDLLPDDTVSVITYSSGSSSSGGDADTAAEYLVLSATGSLSNERVLTAGTGLQSTDAGAGGAFTISVEKEMVFNEKLGGTVDGNNTLFTLSNTPFATNEISIFVNGQLQTPPDLTTWQDYSVTGSNVYFTTGSTPEEGSLILAMYNKVVS